MNMDSEFVHIQGIPVAKGQPPGLRQEFSTWSKDPGTNIQVSLFIRAMQKFQDTDYTERLSYFQIAGIHGFPGNLAWDHSADPNIRWPALQPGELPDKNSHMLYCTHNLITFPTWHRAYMLLFEQTLYNLMGEIIQKDLKFQTNTDKNDWETEREMWRLPYWDWALPIHGSSVPDLFQTEDIRIRAPAALNSGTSGASSETVSNPLYRYQLKVNGIVKTMGELGDKHKVDDIFSKDGDVIFPSSKCSGTSRWGITGSKADWSGLGGVNNYSKIAEAIDTPLWYTAKDVPDAKGIENQSLSDLVYRLLCPSKELQSWVDFSSTAALDNPRATSWENWISLEYIHNNLHVFTGGSAPDGDGHMSHVPVAAFDPIFYMHHANIDRLTAIWQTLNPHTWFAKIEKQPAACDDLTPFHHEFENPTKEVRYFNSDDLRYWSQFGYQYDTLERKDGESDDEYIAGIKKYISKTYYNNTCDVVLEDSSNLIGRRANNKYSDYIIDVLYDRYALDGSPYTIHFFLGSTDGSEAENTANSVTNPKLVGSVYNFSTPLERSEAGQPPSCDNCAQQQNAAKLSLAQVPLTIPLYHEAADSTNEKIGHLDPSEVEHYLADELSWIAVSTSGEQIPWGRLNKTKIFVLKGEAQHFEEDTILSKYGNYVPLYGATEGKPAGASHVDYNF